MPINISKFITTPEQWDAFTEEERIERVKRGRGSPNNIRRSLKNPESSDALKEACTAALEEMNKSAKDFMKSLTELPGLGFGKTSAESLFSRPTMTLPEAKPMPIFNLQETHRDGSSEMLIRRLNERYEVWKNELPQNVQPVVYAVLANGMTMRVHSFAPESYHGIAIEGEIEGNVCLIITHQSALQLLCLAAPVEDAQERRPIGFRYAESA